MEINPFLLAKMLFVAFLFGIQSGIVFDLCRALRCVILGEPRSKKIKKLFDIKRPFQDCTVGGKNKGFILKNVFIFVSDFLWAIYSFCGVVLINYSYNNGGIRAFSVLGAVLGFALYYFTVSKIVIFLTEFLAFLVRFTFFAVFGVLGFPFLKIYNNLVKKVKKRCENIRFRLEKKPEKVYNVFEEVCEKMSVEDTSSKIKIFVAENYRGNKNNRKEEPKNEKK